MCIGNSIEVMSEESDSVNYLSTDDILAIHELIVESNEKY